MSLIQEKVRVVHTGAFMGASNELYALRNSALHLSDVGKRAHGFEDFKGQSQYLTVDGAFPGDAVLATNPSAPRRSCDLVKTDKVLQSMDSGVLKVLSDKGLAVTLKSFFGAKVAVAVVGAGAGDTTLTVDAFVADLPAVPFMVEAGLDKRVVTAKAANANTSWTDLTVADLAVDHAVGDSVSFANVFGNTTVSVLAALNAVAFTSVDPFFGASVADCFAVVKGVKYFGDLVAGVFTLDVVAHPTGLSAALAVGDKVFFYKQ